MRGIRGIYKHSPCWLEAGGMLAKMASHRHRAELLANLISASCEIAELNEHLPPRAGTLFPH